MSEMEEIKPESTAAGATTNLEIGQAVAQLRVLLCGLGGVVLILSLVLNAFVFKQIRNSQGETNVRMRQLQQIENMQQRLGPALNELALYSSKDPELAAIFKRHGVEITLPGSPEASPGTPTQATRP